MTKTQHDLMPSVAEVCADDAEVLALSITRFIASGYMTGDIACWDAAYDGAERVLGPEQGQRLVASLTGVMRAIRAERSSNWSFMPATCCRVTAHEVALIRLVAVARSGDVGAARRAAASLVEAPAAPRTAAAVQVAATMLDATAAELKAPAPVRPRAAADLH